MKRVGILGLPGSGKTTLFEALMQGGGAASGSAGREHVGVVRVPDPRVDKLAHLYRPKKTVYAQIQLVDSVAAGHAEPRPRAKGADLFSSVRECDALIAVVRDFGDAAPPEVGSDPARELQALETELILNDLAIVEARLERIEKELKVGKKQSERECRPLARCKELLEAGHPLRGEPYGAEEEKLLRGFQFLTRKALLVVYNQDDRSRRVPAAPGPSALAMALRVQLEREIVSLPPEERPGFRAEMGMTEDGLSRVIRACYELLGLISFFTVGPDEVRAWTVRSGDRAVDAAGQIHSDMARGFIRAEVIGWRELLEAGGTAGARARGILRLEGRDYLVQDGDCLEIRFNRSGGGGGR